MGWQGGETASKKNEEKGVMVGMLVSLIRTTPGGGAKKRTVLRVVAWPSYCSDALVLRCEAEGGVERRQKENDSVSNSLFLLTLPFSA